MRRLRPEAELQVNAKENKMAEKKFLKESIKVGDKELTVETGRVAKQADGSVIIRYGDTMLLVAAVSAPTTRRRSNRACGNLHTGTTTREPTTLTPLRASCLRG